ncbi:MAG: hypothetical protein JRG91_16675 [Deltaproteobacteria bacterium]|nr:hypothetical protein [Deltaproteobacteria bacterium]
MSRILPLVIALASVCAAACGTTQPWDIWHDGRTAGDGIPDPTTHPGDAPGDWPDAPGDVLPELPPDACDIICTFLEDCGRPAPNCYDFCDRSSEALRLCLLEAAAAGDCEAIDACYEDLEEPPECDPICEFAQTCTLLMPIDFCEDSCTLMASDLIECARAAMEADDCAALMDCWLYPGGIEDQCDAVCEFAIIDCALDLGGITPELCSLGCQSGMLIEEGLLDCLGYSAALRSCLLLYGCAALYMPAP